MPLPHWLEGQSLILAFAVPIHFRWREDILEADLADGSDQHHAFHSVRDVSYLGINFGGRTRFHTSTRERQSQYEISNFGRELTPKCASFTLSTSHSKRTGRGTQSSKWRQRRRSSIDRSTALHRQTYSWSLIPLQTLIREDYSIKGGLPSLKWQAQAKSSSSFAGKTFGKRLGWPQPPRGNLTFTHLHRSRGGGTGLNLLPAVGGEGCC